MMYMNEWDIEQALSWYANDAVLGPAARTLSNLRHATNRCSDGWAYWNPPCRAARQLQQLLEDNRRDILDGDVNRARYRKALVPIRALVTRCKAKGIPLVFDIEEAR